MRVAVIGATGVVGGTILRVLEEREVPVDTLLAYASRDRADGVRFRGATVPVVGGDARAARRRPARRRVLRLERRRQRGARRRAGRRGRDRDRQLVDVPAWPPASRWCSRGEPGRDRARRPASFRSRTARRSCCASRWRRSTRAVGLRSVRVATYQAVSGAGRAGLEALAREERGRGARRDVRRADLSATSCRRSAASTATAIRARRRRSSRRRARCSAVRISRWRRRRFACR